MNALKVRLYWLVTLAMACALHALAAGQVADQPIVLKDEQVKITSQLPRVLGYYHYEFRQSITQGDRLRICVNPVAGAELKTDIDILLPDPNLKKPKLLESSGIAASHDYTMRKKAPGDALIIRIRTKTLGDIRVRVEKVKE